jgi:anti-sigma factor RsiW
MSLLDLHCEEVLEMMTAYLEQSMPADERSELETHMVYCPGCAGFLAQLRSIVLALRELPVGRIEGSERSRLLALFHARSAGTG